ncbi:M15 family metallopeptidase [Variovorax arabinosiphilus]|uniref:M15 family metallopeptidase n=1 Tax=Variovorax arabinosiphilus TaxID=3053498 RepID=UPI002576A2A2|nr:MULTISPECIES: M15 family metallopeptidase [unclassified Variovorax]MDM0119021.1 M15 family metallopeptidase [Variovorax sp. J2L1-78]MDM0129447.1 M15 family metallopeptidase [Variovorax sp. J2L1-63]MDM0232767.1 M15 family metallopeptidase [Variovorax sp. J2R1-6]
MASRALSDLAEPVRLAALAFVARCKAAGLDVLIYCTLRSEAEQAALFAQGRTVPGVIVTNARPGRSLHNPDATGKAWAFDAVPTRSGAPLWADEDALRRMGECGEAVGLEWAGRWRGALRERVHFQIQNSAGGRHE